MLSTPYLFGTKRYEVVDAIGSNLDLVYFSEPDEFKRTVGDLIIDPRSVREQNVPDLLATVNERLSRADCRTGTVREAELEGAIDVDLSDIHLGGIGEAVRHDDLVDFGDIEDGVEESGHTGAFDDSVAVTIMNKVAACANRLLA